MKSLLSNSILEILKNWKDLNPILDFLKKREENLNSEDRSQFIEIYGASGALKGFLASIFVNQKIQNLKKLKQSGKKFSASNADFLFICANEKDAKDLFFDIKSALDEDCEIIEIPFWASIPYRSTAVGSAIFGERSGTLSALYSSTKFEFLQETKPRIFIATLRSIVSPSVPKKYLLENSFFLKVGQKIDSEKIVQKLSEFSYIRSAKVSVRGEFAVRGEVLDIFLPYKSEPCRILLDFDTIEAIKIFDSETQTSKQTLNEILITASKEILWNDEMILRLEKYFQNQKIQDPKVKSKIEKMLLELSEFGASEGEEFFYGLLWQNEYSILGEIPNETQVIFFDYDKILNSEEAFKREYEVLFQKTFEEFPFPAPQKILLDFKKTFFLHKNCIAFKNLKTQAEENQIQNENSENLIENSIEKDKIQSFFLKSQANTSYFADFLRLKNDFEKFQSEGFRIFIYGESENQAQRLFLLLKDFIELDEKQNQKIPLKIIPKAISAGFLIEELKILVVQENEIFGRRKKITSIRGAKSLAIETFVDLSPGDFVVHINYGIAIFKGIERVRSLGQERDYIKLEYAQGDVAFIPTEQANLVQRYIGNSGLPPKLDTLGSKNWENRKNRVKKAVEELAAHLIELYSKRKTSQGFAFSKDNEWQTAFEAAFPYEDTADQITAAREIKDDMESPIPMDRLLCGDVGYGKTEIAMRAVFKAVLGGKQVAFLAPTTILAEQHLETFVERFKNFPIKIERLSRLVPQGEQKKILSAVKNGQIDVLIGTHRILQKDMAFKNLGLLVIDEEQRFGVKDKERLKELKNNIDCLSMSATPIPRTLHMSFLKIRDMSVLATPPQNRKPIETVIEEYNAERVAKAIRAEVERGGQVFFLHNRTETLAETAYALEKIVPEMLIRTAHGKTDPDELEEIFRSFKAGGFHILVSTTIIENGIDIPNVNTIIIDRADMYGISQLYQLRGRVGRSDKKAYAYLFYPKGKALSETAMKRLQVISDFTELGSGFKIAMKDMEIRGAGNLLGRDQSGNVYSVGFDLYLRLLNDAVEKLSKKEEFFPETETLLEMEYTGFVPDSYVKNPQTKMEIYKKIAAVSNNEDLQFLCAELSDRFGKAPKEVQSLLEIAKIRIISKKLFIKTIKEKNGICEIEFSKVKEINVNNLLKLISQNKEKIWLNATQPNKIYVKTGKIPLEQKSAFLSEKLLALSE